jgi:signal transduction histidine kinase
MPDPRYYIDGRHEYVRGYVRRRKRRVPGLVLWVLLLLAIATVWLLAHAWPVVVAVAAICTSIYILRHRRQWQHWFLMRKLRKLEEQQQREAEASMARARITEVQQGRL